VDGVLSQLEKSDNTVEGLTRWGPVDRVTADTGRPAMRKFCANCGTALPGGQQSVPLWSKPLRSPKFVNSVLKKKKERGGYGRVWVIVPSSALAIAAGAGGSGIVGPPVTVNVPDAIANLICWIGAWLVKSLRTVRGCRWSFDYRAECSSECIRRCPRDGQVIVLGLNETRSIPCTVACRDAVVSLGST